MGILQITGLCGAAGALWYIWRLRKNKSIDVPQRRSSVAPPQHQPQELILDPEESDPGLLKKHSEFRSFTTSRFTYPNVRVFHRKHTQADKLPKVPAPLPLLVFIHGLGGSAAQFHPLLTSLVNVSSCIAIDLPGCGRSSFEPKSWDAYKTEALAELLEVIIEEYREKDTKQGVVLIGHSMGCSLAALLASKNSPSSNGLSEHVVGFIAICPKAEPPDEAQTKLFKRLLWVPGTLFDLFRRWDRRGGVNSASVTRFVGEAAGLETRELQLRFNAQSRTPVWRRMASGSLSNYRNGVAEGGLPGREAWAGLDCPVFLVAGEADRVTKAKEIAIIEEFMGKSHPVQNDTDDRSEAINDSAAPFDSSMGHGDRTSMDATFDDELGTFADESFEDTGSMTPPTPESPDDIQAIYDDSDTPQKELGSLPPQPLKPKRVLKTTVLPAPANHALLYMPASVRILAGLVSDFLGSHVTQRLSLGWQLQFLSTSGKWDVKNLAKWQAVAPVSAPIAGIFRAMKTLREVDENHCPEVFARDWSRWVKDVVDISHEAPVYDPRGLEKGGIRYHKLPTVSKIPPTSQEVTEFINLVDRLREEQKERKLTKGWGDELYIAVHCHYGFNRTGFFVVCYLIEREGYEVQEALDEFAKRRPKGIRHAHFMDQLFVRYCKGLKEAPTF
ncbi:hypothetical protein V502_03080 [Pseudogymnoascus sp. VKM F-4520 (FW-2644)]|nr:hypothetical protein V502_03080 [Pseudogymnoascus sp. VKM F-4520 (FW-2644)]